MEIRLVTGMVMVEGSRRSSRNEGPFTGMWSPCTMLSYGQRWDVVCDSACVRLTERRATRW